MSSWVFSYFKVYELLIPINRMGLKGLICQMAIFVIFSESKFYALFSGENHFQIRELVAELHVFLNMVVRYTELLRKLALNVEDVYVETVHSSHKP